VAIQAQRLIRKVCPHCKVKTEIPDDMLKGIKSMIPANYQFYKAKGCDKCNNTGYAGREMISEVLVVDDTIQSMIARGASKEDIAKYADENGFISMFQDAAIRAANGKTTIEEVYRVAKS
jgi:general secretion pathway protein E